MASNRFLTDITVDGKAGIGTISPVQKLHLHGGSSHSYLHFSNTDTGTTDSDGVDIGINTSEEAIIWQRENNIIKLGTNGTERMRITSDGKVGIGNTSPHAELVVAGKIDTSDTANGAFRIYNGSTFRGGWGTGDWAGANFGDSSSDLVAFVSGNNKYFIGTNTQPRLTVDGSGNVGIGTTTPQKKLDVYLGTSNAVASIAGGISAGEYAGLHFGYSETGNSNYRHSAIVFERDDASFGDARGNIHILNSASGSASADLGDARLTILPSGNVGIGTTSPAEKLDVAGTARMDAGITEGVHYAGTGFQHWGDGGTGVDFPANDTIDLLTSSSSRVRIDASGNVGIGTTSPAQKLHVSGGHLQLDDTYKIQWGGTNARIDGSNASDYLRFFTADTERMRVISSGNVGIGTTSPEGRLHVYNGDAGATTANVSHDDLIVENSGNVGIQLFGPATSYQYIAFGDTGSANAGYVRYDHNNNEMRFRVNGSDKVTIASDGDFGIGTTSPSEKLDVVGNATFSGNLSMPSGNIIMGSQYGVRFNDFNTRIYTNSETPEDLIIEADQDLHLNPDGNVELGSRLILNAIDTNTSSTTALVMNGTEVEKRTLGSLAFLSSVTVTWDDLTGDQSNINISGFTNDAGYLTSSNGMTTTGGTITSGNLTLNDNVQLRIGTGHDLRLLHNGTDSLINSNGSGDLYIQQFNDDKDIIFKNDDGSGGITEYLVMDGSVGFTKAHKKIRFLDSVDASFGNSDDLRVLHDGNNGVIVNSTGTLYIRNDADDEDIIFQTDDGSGSRTQYLVMDGSTTENVFYKNVALRDSVQATFGNANDLQIYHDGTNSVLNNTTGDLQIYQQADDKDIQFICDDGSGGVTEYFRVDGAADRTIFSRSTRHSDGVVANFGTSEDLQIYHDGSNSYIENATGNLFIRNNADDADITFQCDAGNGAVTEYFRLDGSHVNVNFAATALFRDNVKAVFGTSSDLQIYHDGSTSFIKDAGTGNLEVWGDGAFIIKSGDGTETKALFDTNGAVELYHDNAKRFETTGSGVALTDHLLLENNKEIRQKDSGGTERTVFELDSSDDLNIGGSYSGALKFIGGGSYAEKMRIHDNGYVGINTASPAEELSVNGDANVTGSFAVGISNAHPSFNFYNQGTAYFNSNVTIDANLSLGDSDVLYLGAGNDLQIYHDGSNSFIADTGTGKLKVLASQFDVINAANTEFMAEFKENAEVKLYYNNSKKFETTSTGVAIDGSLSLGDSDTIYLGDSNDLKIYHNGSHSYILDDGTGELRLNTGNAVRIRKHDNETMALFTANGSVELYYDNSKKFETTSAGITVTGAITASGDITAFSDERLKEDIKPLEESLEKVQAIQGVSFVKKNDEDKKQKIGFIAQQLKEVLPEVVHENEDGIHSVAYGNITALLVEAVKEQQDIISQLEERIIDLENRL